MGKAWIFQIGKACLQGFYALCKCLPVRKDKVLFLSWQTNGEVLDFEYLKKALHQKNPNLRFVTICRRLDGGKLAFGWAMLRSMVHLATTTRCVLNTYWPAVCILNHKKSLKVVQLWHALGKIKQSGYQTLGKEGGRDQTLARSMGMHRNYDYIIAGAPYWNPYYCRSFGVEETVLRNYGLPRIDYLLGERDSLREKIFTRYPALREKPVLLYAPTFRRTGEDGCEELVKAVDLTKYNLVIKAHPNQKLAVPKGAMTCDEFDAMTMLTVADYLITDYSAIALEAAVLRVRTYYYVHDWEAYLSKNGVNINVREAMPGCVFDTADDLIEALTHTPYPDDQLEVYRQTYLPKELGTSTEKICQLILK